MSLPGRLHTIDGVRVFVHRAGTPVPGRPPVLLVHGWMISHWAWRQVIPALVAEGHEVIAIDLPGFGESDRPLPPRYRYDASSYADTLLGVLDALELPRVILVGQSLGGAVSLLAAARHPDRVERLVLVDPLVYKADLSFEGRAVMLPVAGRALFRFGVSRAAIRVMLRRDIYVDGRCASEDWVDYIWERVNRPGGVEAAHAALSTVMEPALIERSTFAVRAPTLIVWGENDRLFPVRFGRRLQGEIAGSELRIIPACGHAPPEERPTEFVTALRPFLAKRAASGLRAAG
jgi:pimeloyl-ACP methyl ester carboxylesterase